MATVQLSGRTGSNVERDFVQLVDEDLLFGRVNGESLTSFLPADLLRHTPVVKGPDTRAVMRTLEQRLGRETVRARLVDRLFELGGRGAQHARRSWRGLGLDYGERRRIGLALQRVLHEADTDIQRAGIARARARFLVGNRECGLETDCAAGGGVRPRYTAAVR